ncbi:hypothetical protein GGX14DRAFT_592230 [Mycena pura]|uniref:Uncharacterized protein n=1 Tax=Mycena pura TaxID=153505 RepID=A0AAD6VWD2_9AGAR|nr:hypothetical protein GGX14DRAFT_592230 [Mycena pura]
MNSSKDSLRMRSFSALGRSQFFDALVFKAAEDGGDLVVVIDALGTEVVAASSEEVVEDNRLEEDDMLRAGRMGDESESEEQCDAVEAGGVFEAAGDGVRGETALCELGSVVSSDNNGLEAGPVVCADLAAWRVRRGVAVDGRRDSFALGLSAKLWGRRWVSQGSSSGGRAETPSTARRRRRQYGRSVPEWGNATEAKADPREQKVPLIALQSGGG